MAVYRGILRGNRDTSQRICLVNRLLQCGELLDEKLHILGLCKADKRDVSA